MTQYLIFGTEQKARDRSHLGHVTDTVVKEVREDPTIAVGDRPAAEIAKKAVIEGKIVATYTTQYRWAVDVGHDGQTAVVIDGDEQLLTQAEQAQLVDTLPDGPGENWEKPPPPVMGGAVDTAIGAKR